MFLAINKHTPAIFINLKISQVCSVFSRRKLKLRCQEKGDLLKNPDQTFYIKLLFTETYHNSIFVGSDWITAVDFMVYISLSKVYYFHSLDKREAKRGSTSWNLWFGSRKAVCSKVPQWKSRAPNLMFHLTLGSNKKAEQTYFKIISNN